MNRKIVCLFITILQVAASAAAVEMYSPGRLAELAVQNSAELAVLMKDEELQLLKKKEAESNYYPRVDFDSSFTYISNPLEPVKLKAGELGSYNSAGGEIMLPPEDYVIWDGMEDMMYSFKLTLEQPLWTWGKIPAAVSVYQSSAAASRQMAEKRADEIVTELYIRLYVLKYADKILGVLEEQRELAERMVEIAEESRINGFLLDADVIEAKVEAGRVGIGITEIEKTVRQSLARIERFTCLEDLDSGHLDTAGLPEGFDSFPLPSETELLTGAETGNDSLKLLLIKKEAGRCKQLLAESDDYLKPDIGLRLEMSYGGPRLPLLETDWFGKDRFNLTASIGLSSRLFDGGELASKILYEQQDLERTARQYQDAVHQVREYVTDSILDMRMNMQNYDYYQLKASSCGEKVKLEQMKLDNGIGSEIDYLDAEIGIRKNIIAGYREMIQYMRAYFEVHAASGLLEEAVAGIQNDY